MLPSDEIVVDTVEQSEDLVAATFYPHRTTPLGGDAPFLAKLSFNALSGVALGELRYSTGIVLHCPHVRDAYHINIPLTGSLTSTTSRYHRGEYILQAGSGAVYSLDEDVVMRSSAPLHIAAIRIDKQLLEETAARLGGENLGMLRPVLATASLTTRSVIRAFYDYSIGGPLAGASLDERISRAVSETLAYTVLAAVTKPDGNRYTAGLTREGQRRAVAIAQEYIRANIDQPISLPRIARDTGVSVRSLQRTFRAELDMTPTEYIRSLRLEIARAELLRLDTNATVSDVALSVGFLHIGRFCAYYREKYGETPQTTLRRISNPQASL